MAPGVRQANYSPLSCEGIVGPEKRGRCEILDQGISALRRRLDPPDDNLGRRVNACIFTDERAQVETELDRATALLRQAKRFGGARRAPAKKIPGLLKGSEKALLAAEQLFANGEAHCKEVTQPPKLPPVPFSIVGHAKIGQPVRTDDFIRWGSAAPRDLEAVAGIVEESGKLYVYFKGGNTFHELVREETDVRWYTMRLFEWFDGSYDEGEYNLGVVSGREFFERNKDMIDQYLDIDKIFPRTLENVNFCPPNESDPTVCAPVA